jgi:DNA-binding winged helix-turn-helix (wHTH) protein
VLRPEQVALGPYVLDLAACELRDESEQPVPLRPQALSLLMLLAERPGRTFSKRELLAALWSDRVVTEDSLVQCVLSARRALGLSGERLLRSVPRRGYRLDLQACCTDVAAAYRQAIAHLYAAGCRYPTSTTWTAPGTSTTTARSWAPSGRRRRCSTRPSCCGATAGSSRWARCRAA